LRRIITAIIVFIIITINDAVTFPSPSSTFPTTQRLDTWCARVVFTPALTWRSACMIQIEVKMLECAIVRQEKALMYRGVRAEADRR
jgi:hypothetical protein